jgi:hypothetical protein
MRRRRQPAMSIVKRTTTWLAVMVAATTTATVVAASPSSAASGDISATANGSVGWAYFNADTMVLSIHDSHADGYGVAVSNYRSDLGDTRAFGWNREGNGTTTYYYLHMPYGARIEFAVCAEKGGLAILSTCGVYVDGYAGPGI